MSAVCFCSWSGGKDSALSLYKSLNKNMEVKYLLNILNESGESSRSHNLSLEIIKAQSDSLLIPLITKKASWNEYENVFIKTLKNFEEKGIKTGVFGDIDIIEHKEWEEKVCRKAGLKAYLPLWNKKRDKLLDEFINLGFKAMIVVVNKQYLDQKYLGKIIDKNLVKEFKDIGIDPNGENGEYHTVVIDGPIFDYEVKVKKLKKVYNDGYYFQNIELINS